MSPLSTFLSKYYLSIGAGLLAYIIPIKADLIFVGSLVMFDWITGMMKGIKTSEFKSSIAIRKFWVSAGYLLGIFVAHSVELYLGSATPIVKPMVAIIAVAEIQSLRENIQILTGLDILKSVSGLFKKK
jgi:hypothetical protein